jgi:hypothetical protein
MRAVFAFSGQLVASAWRALLRCEQWSTPRVAYDRPPGCWDGRTTEALLDPTRCVRCIGTTSTAHKPPIKLRSTIVAIALRAPVSRRPAPVEVARPGAAANSRSPPGSGWPRRAARHFQRPSAPNPDPLAGRRLRPWKEVLTARERVLIKGSRTTVSIAQRPRRPETREPRDRPWPPREGNRFNAGCARRHSAGAASAPICPLWEGDDHGHRALGTAA